MTAIVIETTENSGPAVERARELLDAAGYEMSLRRPMTEPWGDLYRLLAYAG